LGGREPGQNPADLALRDARQRFGLGVVAGSSGRDPVERLLVAPPAVLVDDPVVGDREDPRTELRFGSVEPPHVLPS
jgi:hypothetical protein